VQLKWLFVFVSSTMETLVDPVVVVVVVVAKA
jgi:hypothetical protein